MTIRTSGFFQDEKWTYSLTGQSNSPRPESCFLDLNYQEVLVTYLTNRRDVNVNHFVDCLQGNKVLGFTHLKLFEQYLYVLWV